MNRILENLILRKDLDIHLFGQPSLMAHEKMENGLQVTKHLFNKLMQLYIFKNSHIKFKGKSGNFWQM